METPKRGETRTPSQWERGNPLTVYLSLLTMGLIFAIFVIPFRFVGVASTPTDLTIATGLLAGIATMGFFTWGLWNGIRWGFDGLLVSHGVAALVGVALVLTSSAAWLVAAVPVLSAVALVALAYSQRDDLASKPTVLEASRDLRVIGLISQIVFAIIVAIALSVLWSNIYNTLVTRDLLPTFEFLSLRAGFAITESPDWYSTASTYQQAFIVGVINTLRAVSVGLVGATVLGILLGIFLLSDNWLIKNISRAYVEILRNTPILVQLIFWYYVVMLSLPSDDITIPSEGVFIFSLRLIIYGVVAVGAWIANNRSMSTPNRMVSGVVLGAVLMEVVFYTLGTSAFVMIALGIIGALAIGAYRSEGVELPSGIVGWVLGGGIVAVSQLIGHGILDLLYRAGFIEHPQVIYTEVFPAFFLGRQGFYFPEFWTNQRSELLIALVVAGIALGWVASRVATAISEKTGRPVPSAGIGTAVFALLSVVGWFASQINIPASLGRQTLFLQLELVGEPFNFAPTLATPRFMLFLILAAGALVIAAAVWYFVKNTLESEFVDVPSVTIGVLVAASLLLVSWHVTRMPATSGELLVVQDEDIIGDEGELIDTDVNIISLTQEAAAEREYFGEDISEAQLTFQFSDEPLNIVLPERGRFRFESGTQISLSYAALVIGLVIYTSAFIGEIVRAGIQAVPYGQIEASRALGLSNAQTLRMVILPQALRVIIPPLGNQYLNLAKNSSLATAIAYADTYQVGTTIMNQSGQSITGFTLVLITYLTMSLVISLVMNLVNSRFQIVSR